MVPLARRSVSGQLSSPGISDDSRAPGHTGGTECKGPILRGLAARAPYFHNGSAATLSDVVEFYNQRFNLGFTDQQKSDLVEFLRTL